MHYHDGYYYLIYDCFYVRNGGLYYLRSRDGVYWEEMGRLTSGFVGETRSIANPNLVKLRDGRFLMVLQDNGADRKGTREYWLDVPPQADGMTKWQNSLYLSDNLVDWKHAGTLPFDSRFAYQRTYYTACVLPHGNEYWALVNGTARSGHVGFPVLKSKDGIKWQAGPWNVEVQGLPDYNLRKHSLDGRAFELASWVKVGDLYMISGTSGFFSGGIVGPPGPTGIVIADSIGGPYRLPARNPLPDPGSPGAFSRYFNDINGEAIGMTWLWIARESSWPSTTYFPPLRRLVEEDGSIWAKWWSNNDRLKQKALGLEISEKGGRTTYVADASALRTGVVLEGDVRVAVRTERSSGANLALGASVVASHTFRPDNCPGAFDPSQVTDGSEVFGWSAISSHPRMIQEYNDEDFRYAGQFSSRPATLVVDLRQSIKVGRVRLVWPMWCRRLKDYRVWLSNDSIHWNEVPPGKARWVFNKGSRIYDPNDPRKGVTIVSLLEGVNKRAHYVKVDLTGVEFDPDPDRPWQSRDIYYDLGLWELEVYAAPYEKLSQASAICRLSHLR